MEVIISLIVLYIVFQVVPILIGGVMGFIVGLIQAVFTNLDRIIPAIVLYLPLKILQFTNFLQYFLQKPWRYFLQHPGNTILWIYKYRIHWIALQMGRQ